MEEKTNIVISKVSSMVDVGEKAVTRRVAQASCYIHFPEQVFEMLRENDFLTHKGSIINTSVVAGLMAVKKTSDILPLCHPLQISGTDLDITPEENKIKIECTVKCEGKTGVEMEALTGASVAALCIYDMCKAFSHDLEITDLKLNFKKGGKSDYGG
ncbi:cyclic pyranopterin monophosphate synthase MoaC [Pontibacter akesuensis]|uniref:cyclic pyranopterin monophosphate synthase n=1 Tax=Pontibacter akesuensis TaxID=388950 RepID=A0A1I7KTX0_9BACT|nr:cyclic pyranopterin monophosphate synthase MoaC [Pontibacter akesuensis]GHA80696.1 cyclic pyranopterin monophosphate synthase accessory protein [Pontibacter akesuensis]SFV00756.1 cyclic pyranopterin monophosphate synthase subunit MoaC [Pontibacter akesuensis]